MVLMDNLYFICWKFKAKRNTKNFRFKTLIFNVLIFVKIVPIYQGRRKGVEVGLATLELDILQEFYYLRKGNSTVFAYFLPLNLST